MQDRRGGRLPPDARPRYEDLAHEGGAGGRSPLGRYAERALHSVTWDVKAETRWRTDAAKPLLPRQTAAPASGSGPMIIDATSEAARARIGEHLDRLRELELKDLLGADLTADEQTGLERLHAWVDALPPHPDGPGR